VHMHKLVVHPYSTAAWQAIVNEASQARSITLSENIESYLVLLLKKFATAPEISAKIMAFDYMEAVQAAGIKQQQLMQNVGDQCLLYSGLFPGIARKRRVSISYFVNLGRNAYLNRCELEQLPSLASLYKELGEEFIVLVDVLHAMRELNQSSPSLDPLQAIEVWQDLKLDSAIKNLANMENLVDITNRTRH